MKSIFARLREFFVLGLFLMLFLFLTGEDIKIAVIGVELGLVVRIQLANRNAAIGRALVLSQ